MSSVPDPRTTSQGPWARPAWGADLEPPGTYSSIVNRLGGKGTTEIGIVHEHRFAFWFWNRWARQASRSTGHTLVSIDWHQDLCAPDSEESASLAVLDRTNDSEIALFAWSQLNPLNDGHVRAASEVGIIGDVYVLCRQELLEEEEEVHVFRDPELFRAAVSDLPEAILDIDLDYFIQSSEPFGGVDKVRLVPYAEIERVLNPRTGVIAALVPKLVGITIAIEPEWCGGLKRAHRLLQAVNEIMFDGSLLTDDVHWRTAA